MNNDLISRQAAIELIKNNSYTIIHGLNDVEKGMTLYGIIQALEYLPSVQPKTGHWIANDDYDGEVYYTCSRCEEPWVTIDGTPQENRMRYCPHCGAKMKGETE